MRTSPHVTPLTRRAARGRRRNVRVALRAIGYWIVRRHAWLAAGAFGYALANRAFVDPLTWGLSHGVAITSLLGLVGLRVAARFGPPIGPAVPAADRQSVVAHQEDLNLGLLLVVAFHVLFQFTGGQASPYYPLTYLFIAFASAFSERSAGAVVLLFCLGAEALGAAAAGISPATAGVAAVNGAFILVFSASWWGFLKGHVVLQRRQHQQAFDEQNERTLDEAREFKLIASPLTRDSRTRPREEEERIQLKEAVEGIRRTVRSVLDLLRDAYGLHTCALYWQDGEGRLKLRDAISASEVFDGRSLGAKEGLLGAAFTQRQPVRQHDLRRDDPRIAYYQPGENVFAILAVPVFQGSHVRGVLIGDRRTQLAFTEKNEAVFVSVAKLVADAVDNERVFLETERAKDAQERFHRGLKELNSAQEVSDVHQAVIGAVTEVADFDFVAITENDEEAEVHRIVCVSGPGAQELIGLEVPHGKGLVSQVTQIKTYLPVTGRPGRHRGGVFNPDVGPFDMKSLVVMPLSYGEDVVGTITLASESESAYSLETRVHLEVVNAAAAQALVNSRYFQRVQELATTDPLTGLFNRRVLMERFEEMAARARRSGRALSFLLCDLDHFKKINDSFGHSAGDEVLRRTAEELQRCVRETDVVARYGGEEFAVLLEEADAEACAVMAERIRASIADLLLESAAGEIRPTTSVGCTTWDDTDSACDREALVDEADKALYRAKHLGRDRAVHYRDMEGAR